MDSLRATVRTGTLLKIGKAKIKKLDLEKLTKDRLSIRIYNYLIMNKKLSLNFYRFNIFFEHSDILLNL